MSFTWQLLEVGGTLVGLYVRVNSSGSQKTADSHVALRGNFSAPVRSRDSAKVSKNAASLVD